MGKAAFAHVDAPLPARIAKRPKNGLEPDAFVA
jgi:hypothetical protein